MLKNVQFVLLLRKCIQWLVFRKIYGRKNLEETRDLKEQSGHPSLSPAVLQTYHLQARTKVTFQGQSSGQEIFSIDAQTADTSLLGSSPENPALPLAEIDCDASKKRHLILMGTI